MTQEELQFVSRLSQELGRAQATITHLRRERRETKESLVKLDESLKEATEGLQEGVEIEMYRKGGDLVMTGDTYVLNSCHGIETGKRKTKTVCRIAKMRQGNVAIVIEGVAAHPKNIVADGRVRVMMTVSEDQIKKLVKKYKDNAAAV